MAEHQPELPTPPKGAHEPGRQHAAAGKETNNIADRGAGHQNPYYPRAAGENDASAEANARVASEIAGRAAPPIPAEQLVTQPTSEPLVGGRAMYVLVGPYRGSVLTMTDADGESAKDNHWAIDIADMAGPFDANTPYDHDHELTDEDRAYAVKEANEWAAAQSGQGETDDDEAEAAPEGETEDQRKQREKRNDERRRQKPDQKPAQQPARQPGQQPHPGQQPAQQPGHQAGQPGRGRTVGSPNPAGTYETR
jgi:hypothetical protein